MPTNYRSTALGKHKLRTFANHICGKNAKEQASSLRLRLQAFDLICRHDLNLWLPVAKLDCASDADDFPLNHSESPIGRYSGLGRNKSSERLSGVFSSETDKCRTQRAGRHRDNPASYLDFFADIPNGFRVFYHFWLVCMHRNRAEKQYKHFDEKTVQHCRMPCILASIDFCTIGLIPSLITSVFFQHF